MPMSKILGAGKRQRACKTCKATGARKCNAAAVGLEPCAGDCRAKLYPLASSATLQQRAYLTRHLCAGPEEPTASVYRPRKPPRCPMNEKLGRRKCRAALQCPIGRCCASYKEAVSEERLHEFAQFHGRDGAGAFWELAALETAGQRPNPGQLNDRDEMVRAERTRLAKG